MSDKTSCKYCGGKFKGMTMHLNNCKAKAFELRKLELSAEKARLKHASNVNYGTINIYSTSDYMFAAVKKADNHFADISEECANFERDSKILINYFIRSKNKIIEAQDSPFGVGYVIEEDLKRDYPNFNYTVQVMIENLYKKESELWYSANSVAIANCYDLNLQKLAFEITSYVSSITGVPYHLFPCLVKPSRELTLFINDSKKRKYEAIEDHDIKRHKSSLTIEEIE
jgi:hypothetical protein